MLYRVAEDVQLAQIAVQIALLEVARLLNSEGQLKAGSK